MRTRTMKVKEESSKFTKKQLGDLLKLDLANEVAYEHLKKKNLIALKPVSGPTPLVSPASDPEPSKKRRRQKRLLEPPEVTDSLKTVTNVTEAAVTVANEQQEKKKPKLSKRISGPTPIVGLVSDPGPPRTRVKQKRPPESSEVTETTTVTSPTDSDELFEVSPKKSKGKASTGGGKKTVVPCKNKAATTKPVPIKKKEKAPKIPKTKSKPLKTPTIIKVPANRLLKKPTSRDLRTRKEKVLRQKGKPDAVAEVTSPPETTTSPSLLEQVEVKLFKKSDDALASQTDVSACKIDSRKTSMTGTSECLSWTKDISSSSTTTCVTVCSQDFVRIDKKLPILQLPDVKFQKSVNLQNDDSSSDTDSSSSESSVGSPKRRFSPDIESRSLLLSSSSETNITCTNSKEVPELTPMDIALDKLKSKLDHFDMEIVNWISYDNAEEHVQKFQDKIFAVLKEESEVMLHCQRLKHLLVDESDKENIHGEQVIGDVRECHNDTVTEDIVSRQDNVDLEVNSNSHAIDAGQDDRSISAASGSDNSDDDENCFTSDRSKYVPFDQYDDDDALSLYAESITGIDSSRINNSTASAPNNAAMNDLEEYVPQPVCTEVASKINYVPSKILNNDAQTNDLKRIICEKQNADSTSISKVIKFRQPEALSDINESSQNKCIITINKNKGPCLMASAYKPYPGVKSVLFHGVCFFNLISSCKNQRCRYPHVILDRNVIISKLATLSEEHFIIEYMLLRNWPILRRMYGMCFVEECQKRKLTRIVVEMAIDYHMKANDNIREDSILKVAVIESVLMYLNHVNLDTCEDLLLYNVQNNIALCDIFMQVIANTQNFSRFKAVFINLCEFIISHEKLFNLTVATQILERVCILPYEQSLSEALLGIIQYTNSAIFENSMIATLEKQLSLLNKGLHTKLLELKKEAFRNKQIMKSYYNASPPLNVEPELVMNTSVHNDRERYTSPDTTNLDNMNKALEEQTVTRIVDFRGRLGANIQRSFVNSNSSTDSEEIRSKPSFPSPNYLLWKGQSVLDKIANIPSTNQRLQFRTPQLIKRRILQQPRAGSTQPPFGRNSGPDFF
ncbi:hypothetical protein ACJJTC_006009 [Scirpophaga incertulas]